jgi:putative component of membrane protein insertase Oxa1/YidC/SpoIIIJ protein YidD
MNKCIFILILFIVLSVNLLAQISTKSQKDNGQIQKQTLSQTEKDSSQNFNIAITAIKGWQQISFRSSFFNCPFHPCCSNYAIQAFREKGFIKGIFYTADRISRCHPFAYKYYSKTNEGFHRELGYSPYYSSDHLPYLSIPISFVLPGFNKMINGRFYDGLAMLLITEISAYGAYITYENENYFYIPFAFIFLSFYSSDVYFNFLSL